MAGREVKEWKLFYEEKNFRSFEKLLLTELTKADLSNALFLSAKYSEDDLPLDPVGSLLGALTAAQKTAFDAFVETADTGVPTKLEVLIKPTQEFHKFTALVESSAIPNAKVNVYKGNVQNHLEKEFELYKKLAKTLLHTRYMLDLAPFGAGRGLLRIMRERNKVNKTQQQSTELLNQFLAFRILANEKVEEYKIRLQNLKNDLQTADTDPQPVSKRFFHRIYIAGLRIRPLLDAALNKITDVEDKTNAYVHAKMIEAQGDEVDRIKAMHGDEDATATAAAAYQRQPRPPPPPPPPQPTQRQSYNGKQSQPDCPDFVQFRKCKLGSNACPYNHPVLPKLTKKQAEIRECAKAKPHCQRFLR